ncbi:MAG: DUF5615 family PIN-like protein [Chloroflexota bacterium]
MNFLLDMGLAQSTAIFLKELGHDAVHLRDEGLQQMQDEDIIAKAQAENRVILTHDLDFGRIVALSGSTIPSVVTFRLENMRPVNVNYYLAAVLEVYSKELESGVMISVNEESIRARSLPV